jgi:hypothetical protein
MVDKGDAADSKSGGCGQPVTEYRRQGIATGSGTRLLPRVTSYS